MSGRVKRAILKLTAEYIIITSPILIYASLEALHHGQFKYLIKSPEWSIATIFITIQTIRMYLDQMHDNAGRLFSSLLILLLTLITLSAGINIYIGLGDIDHPSMATMATKWGLLALASMVFVYVAGAAIYSSEH